MEKFNTDMLNFLAYVGIAGGYEVMLSGWSKVGLVLIPAWDTLMSCDTTKQSVCRWLYIYTYIYTQLNICISVVKGDLGTRASSLLCRLIGKVMLLPKDPFSTCPWELTSCLLCELGIEFLVHLYLAHFEYYYA